MSQLPRLLRSLEHRDFRRYFFGQMVSLCGTWMQHVAQSWLVYRLTGSSFMLGLVAFLGLLPVLFVGLPAGLVSDRLPRRTVLIAVQWVSMAQALTLGALTLSGQVEVWQVILLAALLGVAQAFEMPARHALVAEIVPRANLPNAIALNSSLFNMARFVGPALAGVLIAVLGEGWLFMLNALSFTAFLVALQGMAARPRPATAGAERRGIRPALEYAWHSPVVRSSLALVCLISFVGAPYTVLMPVFAKEVYAAGPEMLGLLLGAGGLGALLGAMWLAHGDSPGGHERVIGKAGILAGAALCTFAVTSWLPVALPALVLAGFGLTTLVAGCNTRIQMHVEDALRARVMALFSVLFIGMTPFGNLLAGALAEVVGVQWTVTAYGLLCALGAWRFLAVTAPAVAGE